MIKKTLALVALAVALPTGAFAENNGSYVDPYALMRNGSLQQAMREGQANVEAFRNLVEQRARQAGSYTGSIYTGGTTYTDGVGVIDNSK